MECRYCGATIPKGTMVCPSCGREMQMVPDYSPLDDALAAGIVDSIDEDRTRNMQSGSWKRSRSEKERDSRARRMREKKRRRRRTILIMVLILIVALIVLAYVTYQSSYTGMVGKGNRALKAQEFESAIEYFQEAIGKKAERPEAYTGLSQVYIAQDDLEAAEAVFSTAVADQSENADLYEAYVEFYMDTQQQAQIPQLLSHVSDSVAEALSTYIIEEPVFSLDEYKTFDEVQELSLTCAEGTVIYYTDDGTDPTVDSIAYTDPIQLSEGTTEIRAIAVDERKIPSLTVEKTYTVELPIEDAPAVSPSTGQYDQAMTIEVKVPTDYTAYYTMDGSDPTVGSDKYEGPIDMPEGETLFKAILVSATGRQSGITTRNYVLDTSTPAASAPEEDGQ